MLVVGMNAVFVFEAFESFFVAEAIVRSAEFDKLFCVFFINARSLGLNVRTVATVFIRTFVVGYTCRCESAVHHFHRAFDLAFLVGIFDTEDKFTPVLRAKRKAYNPVRRLPMCINPVGDGANLVLTVSLIKCNTFF